MLMSQILTLEIAFIFILYESVATGLSGLLIDDNIHAPNATVLLETISEGSLISLV